MASTLYSEWPYGNDTFSLLKRFTPRVDNPSTEGFPDPNISGLADCVLEGHLVHPAHSVLVL
jgi:hypothetical protein